MTQKKQGKELDPNTQLEKRALVQCAANACSEPKLTVYCIAAKVCFFTNGRLGLDGEWASVEHLDST